ncbi:MAG: hypothetical protein AAGF84_03535 [Planctomycetota bacterium]
MQFVRISAAATLTLTVGSAHAQPAVVDFESIAAPTTLLSGGTAGTFLVAEDNIDVTAETFTLGTFSNVGNLTVNAAPAPIGSGNTGFIGNVLLDFDFTNLGYAVDQVTFDYANLGGGVNLGVNGNVIEPARLATTPLTLFGINVAVTETAIAGGVAGTVTLTGALDSIQIGGQELVLDNVTAIPEPASSTVAAGLLALTATRLRRRDRQASL